MVNDTAVDKLVHRMNEKFGGTSVEWENRARWKTKGILLPVGEENCLTQFRLLFNYGWPLPNQCHLRGDAAMSSSITAKRTETKFTCIISILNAENVPAGIEFYVEAIGFETDWEWGGPPGFGSVSRGDSRIMPRQGNQVQAGTRIWIGVEDGGEFYKEYKVSGANIREVPTNYPWAHEMRVEELDNRVLRFGSEQNQTN